MYELLRKLLEPALQHPGPSGFISICLTAFLLCPQVPTHSVL